MDFKFEYGDKVVVVADGFYKGEEGYIKNITKYDQIAFNKIVYTVILNNYSGEEFSFSEDQLKLKEKGNFVNLYFNENKEYRTRKISFRELRKTIEYSKVKTLKKLDNNFIIIHFSSFGSEFKIIFKTSGELEYYYVEGEGVIY